MEKREPRVVLTTRWWRQESQSPAGGVAIGGVWAGMRDTVITKSCRDDVGGGGACRRTAGRLLLPASGLPGAGWPHRHLNGFDAMLHQLVIESIG